MIALLITKSLIKRFILKLWIHFSKGKFANDQKKFYAFLNQKFTILNCAKLTNSEDMWEEIWGDEARIERKLAFERKTNKRIRGF